MRILILTCADDEIRGIGDVSAANKRRYAEMYGYSFVYAQAALPWHNWQGFDRSWDKIPLVQKYLASFDWIWWSDADSLIRNFQIKIEDILATDKDLVIGRDHQPFVMPTAPSEPVSRVGMINAGNFFIRNCPWSAGFLAQVVNSTWIEALGFYHREQGAMIRLLDDPYNASHVQYAPMCAFNSYADHVNSEEAPWKTQDVYQDGDFVIHWAGTVPDNAGVLAEMRRPKKRFGILTLCVGEMRQSIGDFAANGKQRYAKRHDYDFIYRTESVDSKRDGSWNKIPWLQRHLPDYEWLMWCDADTIICNSDVRLEDLVEGCTKDLIIGWDHQPCLNAGNFLIRNCPWAFDFLARVWMRHDQGGFVNGRWQREWPYHEREQGVMQSFIKEGPDGDHVELRGIRQLGFSYRHNKLKSNPQGFAWAVPDTYQKGDFLKHFGGWWCQEGRRLTRMWDPASSGSEFIP